jgi:flagellar biosynthesis protein
MKSKDKEKKAVALKYQPGSDTAPKVVAKGKGQTAERILEIAREHNIFVHNDPDLIEILSQLDLNDEIPPDLYLIVAELLAFIYGLNKEEKAS